jgi:hypothetical protein
MRKGSKGRDLIERYGLGGSRFDRFIEQGCPEELLDYRPPIEDAWTIREHLAHVVDTEVNAYVRYRKCIAEPGGRVCVFDEERWKQALGYADQPLEESLSVFKLLRALTYRHLKTLDQTEWNGYFVVHPERGRFSLDDWLATYTGHIDVHEKYIMRNESLWDRERTGALRHGFIRQRRVPSRT